MKKSKNGKALSGPEAAREDYLKKVNSPNYRRNIKRSLNLLETYNRVVRNSALPQHELRRTAEYFLDDIKNPVFGRVMVEKDNDDSVKDALKPIKI